MSRPSGKPLSPGLATRENSTGHVPITTHRQFLPSTPEDRFMRFKIFAAALSAVVLSAAFQSAEAGLVIDDFNNNSTSSSGSSTAPGDLVKSTSTPSGNSGFDTRSSDINFNQFGGSGRTAANFTGSFAVNTGGNGLGVLSMGKDALTSGSSYNTLAQSGFMSWYNQNNSAVNLAGDGLQVVIAASSTSGRPDNSPIPSFNAYDINGNHALWSPGPFAPGTYTGNYATDWGYTGTFDWTQVTRLEFGNGRLFTSGDRAAAFATSVSFDSIGVVNPVPEPSTYAMAFAGLACGAWQMVRRRRAR